MVKFKATPRKAGGSHVITIPKDYIKNGLINITQEIEFEAKEVNK